MAPIPNVRAGKKSSALLRDVEKNVPSVKNAVTPPKSGKPSISIPTKTYDSSDSSPEDPTCGNNSMPNVPPSNAPIVSSNLLHINSTPRVGQDKTTSKPTPIWPSLHSSSKKSVASSPHHSDHSTETHTLYPTPKRTPTGELRLRRPKTDQSPTKQHPKTRLQGRKLRKMTPILPKNLHYPPSP